MEEDGSSSSILQKHTFWGVKLAYYIFFPCTESYGFIFNYLHSTFWILWKSNVLTNLPLFSILCQNYKVGCITWISTCYCYWVNGILPTTRTQWFCLDPPHFLGICSILFVLYQQHCLQLKVITQNIKAYKVTNV